MLPEFIERKRRSAVSSVKIPPRVSVRREDGLRTDSGVYPHGDNANSLAKCRMGMKPLEAIQAATSTRGSARLGRQDRCARDRSLCDLIAVNGDPVPTACP